TGGDLSAHYFINNTSSWHFELSLRDLTTGVYLFQNIQTGHQPPGDGDFVNFDDGTYVGSATGTLTAGHSFEFRYLCSLGAVFSGEGGPAYGEGHLDLETRPLTTGGGTASILCPPDRQLQCGDPMDPQHTGTATASDGNGGSLPVTFTDVASPASC